MDQPLTTWYCDTCDEKIGEDDTGYVVWNHSDGPQFRIIHQKRCDDHGRYMASLPLKDFLGDTGATRLISMLSRGPVLPGGDENTNGITDFNAFADFFRRVQTPYYEQARRLFHESAVLNAMHSANEVYPYLPSTLKEMVEEYG